MKTADQVKLALFEAAEGSPRRYSRLLRKWREAQGDRGGFTGYKQPRKKPDLAALFRAIAPAIREHMEIL